MIKGIHHVALSVENLERSVAFYRDLLLMEELTSFGFEGPQFSSVLGLDNVRGRMSVLRKHSLMLELFEFAQPRPAARAPDEPVSALGISHFGIEVEDIERVYTDLCAQGVRFHSPVATFPSGMRAAYGRDCDGNVFEILEMTPAEGVG